MSKKESNPDPPKLSETSLSDSIRFQEAFTEWDKRYRADPQDFMSSVEHLLENSVVSYGKAASIYFISILKDLE